MDDRIPAFLMWDCQSKTPLLAVRPLKNDGDFEGIGKWVCIELDHINLVCRNANIKSCIHLSLIHISQEELDTLETEEFLCHLTSQQN